MRYRSNLAAPDLESAFRHVHEWKGPFGHTVIGDREFNPDCGFLTHDEAAILFHVAGLASGHWVDIGAHTGWSAAHAAIAGRNVFAVEPSYVEGKFAARAWENLVAAKVADRVKLFAGTSEEFFWQYDGEFIGGALVDANHEDPMPLKDAMMLLLHLKPSALIVFHDFSGQPIRKAVQALIDRGFQYRVYNTPQFLTVCWRGDFSIPYHQPDPRINWALARRGFRDFSFRGES